MLAAPACGLLRAVRLPRPRGFHLTRARETAEGLYSIDIHRNPRDVFYIADLRAKLMNEVKTAMKVNDLLHRFRIVLPLEDKRHGFINHLEGEFTFCTYAL